VSLRAVDMRFLLPQPPARAMCSETLPAVRAGFAEAGVSESDHRPDVAVVTAQEVPAALAVGSRAVVVLGRGARRLLARNLPVVRRFVTLPGAHEPHVVIPVDRAGVARYAIETWAAAESRVRRRRNQIAAALIALGAFPDLHRSLTVGLEHDAQPYLVAAAVRFGLDPRADWFLTLGLGDALTRAVFHLFEAGADLPRWVLKFTRIANYTDPFDRDERGLRLAASAGGPVAAHAPRLLARLQAGGLPASLEDAAPGRRLTFLLQTPGHRHEKIRTIEEVASWIVASGRYTAASPMRLKDERRRLVTDVLPAWRDAGVPQDLVARVPGIPAVLAHNDLGCWNLIVGARDFRAVDWESARAHALPLWDLIYFLVDALVHFDGAWSAQEREQHATGLLLGSMASSAILFRWIRAGAESLDIPSTAVGTIVTLCWLHHGLSSRNRGATVDSLSLGARSSDTYGEWMARVWLTTPGLGVGWTAWTS
jgi:hypothetical protein